LTSMLGCSRITCFTFFLKARGSDWYARTHHTPGSSLNWGPLCSATTTRTYGPCGTACTCSSSPEDQVCAVSLSCWAAETRHAILRWVVQHYSVEKDVG
jgi:hypothetical protein